MALKRDRSEARDKVIQVRVTTSEADILRGIAKANDWTMADLLREALDDWLQRRKGRKGR